MSGVKLITKQVEPIKGYEHFETTSGSDGTFRFKKLYPTSKYEIIPWFDDWSVSPLRTLVYEADDLRALFSESGWKTSKKLVVRSGPEGQTVLLKSPIKILQTICTVEGRLVDAQGKPLPGVKLIAKQVKPIKGYEQFETTTGADGSFRFDKLYPLSKYRLIPQSLKTNARKTIRTGGDEQTTRVFLIARFIRANGVVRDTKTGLMWAARDNGRDINWRNARAYCANYKGGGFTDWRLPTMNELAELYRAGIRGIRDRKDQIISLTGCSLWALETRGSKAALFSFDFGSRDWSAKSNAFYSRALPVRGGK